jgi:hypothetical protein
MAGTHMTIDDREPESGFEEFRPNPYAGPRALQQGEPIYGRVREINELRGAILSERIVLLYSQSGAGKTSLIEAGLRPEFERRRFNVLPTVRVGYDSPPETPEANRYRLSVLTSLESVKPAEEQLTAHELASVSLLSYFEGVLDAEPGLDLFVVFDQFEEVFTLDPTDWEEKEAFLQELGVALANRSIFALFSMREDFIAQLDPYQASMPTRFSNTYRLELLGPSDARLAIQKPADAAGVVFADDAAQGLVDDLRRVRVDRGGTSSLELGPSVEPVQLQVVCAQLWEHLEPGATVIRSQNVDDIGNVNEALAGYYASQVAAVAGRTRVKEGEIRAWFEHDLISDDGFRTQTREGPGRKNEQVLSELEDSHLIRADRRRGTQWYELTHDRFVEPIRTSNSEFHRRRRRKRLKVLVPAGAILLMALTSIAVDLYKTAPTAASDAPAKQLSGTSFDDDFVVPASAVVRYRFDDGNHSDEVTLVVTALAADSSLGIQPEVDVRLLLVGTEETGEDLETGATIAVPPNGAVAVEAASGLTSTTEVGSPTTSTTKALQDTIRPTERTYTLPADGSYFIEFSASSAASIAFNYERVAGDGVPELTVGIPVQGQLDLAGAIGRFDFTVAEDETVELILDSLDSLDGVLTMLGETAELIESVDVTGVAGRELMVVALPGNRTYTINVSGFDGSTGAYTLELRRPEVVPIAAGSLVEGITSADGTASVFSFSADKGEAVIITLSLDEDVGPVLEVKGDSSRQVGIPGFDDDSLEAAQVWAGGAGLVIIRVQSDSQRSFTLDFQRQSNTVIEVEERFEGHGQSGQLQYFSFKGLLEQTYAVEVTGTGALSAIFAPGDVLVVSEVFVAPFDGDYLVVFEPDSTSDFTILVTQPELEKISYGDSKVEDVVADDQSLWYEFEAEAGDTYSVTLESDRSSTSGFLLVTAPDGIHEVFDQGGADIEVLFVNAIAPLNGTYLITVVPDGEGVYTTSLDS